MMAAPSQINVAPKQEEMAKMIGKPQRVQEYQDVPDVEIQAVPCVAKVCTFFPLFGWAATITCVSPNHHQAILHCGKLTRVLTEPGIHCIWGCGDKKNVSVMQQVTEVPKGHGGNLKVVDRKGSPLIVSAILNYRVVDARKALFAVEDFNDYVQKKRKCHFEALCRYSYIRRTKDRCGQSES